MSPPIGQSVKQQVIELYTSGRISPHDITDDLNKLGIRISYGSVWNILDTYKKHQHEHNSSSGPSSQLLSSESNRSQASVSSSILQQQQEAQIYPKTPQYTAINIEPIITDTGSPSSNRTPHSGDGLTKPDSKTSGTPLYFLLSSATSAVSTFTNNSINIIETYEEPTQSSFYL